MYHLLFSWYKIFWEELLTKIVRSFYRASIFYTDIKLCVFEENQLKEAITVTYHLYS